MCADYKILAKILTERIKKVLSEVIDVEQQGFIKDGDITGSIILVKEIIDYCNENNVEGNVILIDFMKAYDRVDREAMFMTLQGMNFGDEFINMTRVLYKQVLVTINVNDELTEEFVTGGGVRQGCPLSPYLFIMVLELLAIELKKSTDYTGIVEPITGQEDKASFFADDSSIYPGKPEEIKPTRACIQKFEEATAAKQHDGKTKLLLVGKNRNREITNENIGVDYDIMKDDDIERYLGDMVGNEVKDEDRHEDKINEAIQKGEEWNRENITMIGRSLVANTIIYSKVKFRLDINCNTKETRKQIKKMTREFIWKYRKPQVRWEIMVRPREEGGMAVRDPECMMDAAKIMIIKRLQREKKQPWMKWIERKMAILKVKWKRGEHILTSKPKAKMIRELDEKNLTELMVKIWYEIGGMSRYEYDMKNEEKKKQEIEERDKKQDMKEDQLFEEGFGIAGICPIQEKKRRKEKRKEDENERKWNMRKDKIKNTKILGMEINKEWKELEKITTKDVYWKLVDKRLKIKYTPSKAHEVLKEIENTMTPREREYWWKLTHNIISIKQIENKWRKNDDGTEVSPMCPMCEKEIENRKHYNFECEVIQEWKKQVEMIWNENKDEKENITEEEWGLIKEGNEKKKNELIAKARYVYHETRNKVMTNKRKGPDIRLMINKLKNKMIISEKQKKKKETERKKKNERREIEKEKKKKQKEKAEENAEEKTEAEEKVEKKAEEKE